VRLQRVKATQRDCGRRFKVFWESRPLLTTGPIQLTVSLSSLETRLREFKIPPLRHHCTMLNISEWATVTVDEFQKLIKSALNKTCQLDPAPSWLVKNMCDLSPFLTLLFNKSLDTGCFPMEFMQAVVRPLLEENGLDDSKLKNFRPVSNLSFISKLLEKIVKMHIQAFFDSNGLMPKMQSAYRQFQSTDTAVTKVFSDLLVAADSGQMLALCLLRLKQSSTPSTMTCCYSGLNASLDCVASC